MPEIATGPFHHNQSDSQIGFTFIQWKGTDVCMDWICPACDEQYHVDADFCYKLKCLACGSVYDVGQSVTLTRTDDESGSLVECAPENFP